MTAFRISPLPSESWRDCAARLGRERGLEGEVMEHFEKMRQKGFDDETAAFDACYEWDLCEIIEESWHSLLGLVFMPLVWGHWLRAVFWPGNRFPG